MILTCPACGTRYTVKDGAIPPGGRQVRCANCKHSWHQDPEEGSAATDQAAVAPPVAPVDAADNPAPVSDVAAGAENYGQRAAAAPEPTAEPESEHDYAEVSEVPEEAPADHGWEHAPSVEAEPQTITSAGEVPGARTEAFESAPAVESESEAAEREADQRYAMAQDPGLSTPAPPLDEAAGWTAPAAAAPVDVDFAAYDSGSEEFSGGRGKLMIGLLVVLAIIVAAVAAFWFLAPTSFKERIGLAQATDTPLLIQVDQRNRRTLASGNQLLEVSGKVINPTDQTRQVPPLQAQLRSLDQQVVYRWTIPPPAPSLQPGGSASFNSAELNIPPAAACLDVSFDRNRAPEKKCVPEGATRAG
ncbi:MULTISPECIES: zinc-ribbon domain-containing protein [Sphingomonas]|uniref:zinc-ribbon domain-containing protein n=1 Tax=Sphingomonas TaxID=13687 RepID=UPI000DEFAFC7|nr:MULTISPECIES: zinc-ribbon domain-containing protein [Sphingomonas]